MCQSQKSFCFQCNVFLQQKNFYCSLFQVPCSLFMFYECNGQRCNNGEVMSSDHHVIGSGFADDVNVINVTATDFHHQSILLRNCPFHLSFRGGSNMFLVNFSVLISCNVKTKTIIDGFVMINVVDVWPATSSGGKLNLNFQSKIPPQDILLCLRDCVCWVNPITVTTSSAIIRDKILEITFADDVWNLKDISNWIWSRIGDFPW